MPSIAPVSTVRPVAPSTKPVISEVQSNDPKMRATLSGNVVNLKGVATNNGIVASFFSMNVDGKQVSVQLSRGMSPAQAFDAISKAMPKGYEAHAMAVMPMPGVEANISFYVSRSAPAGIDSSKNIEKAFAKATRAGSAAGGDVSYAELRTALRAGLAGDNMLTDAEKDTFARSYAGLFDGARRHATAAAQKEYAKLQEKYDLPVYMVR